MCDVSFLKLPLFVCLISIADYIRRPLNLNKGITGTRQNLTVSPASVSIFLNFPELIDCLTLIDSSANSTESDHIKIQSVCVCVCVWVGGALLYFCFYFLLDLLGKGMDGFLCEKCLDPNLHNIMVWLQRSHLSSNPHA